MVKFFRIIILNSLLLLFIFIYVYFALPYTFSLHPFLLKPLNTIINDYLPAGSKVSFKKLRSDNLLDIGFEDLKLASKELGSLKMSALNLLLPPQTFFYSKNYKIIDLVVQSDIDYLVKDNYVVQGGYFYAKLDSRSFLNFFYGKKGKVFLKSCYLEIEKVYSKKDLLLENLNCFLSQTDCKRWHFRGSLESKKALFNYEIIFDGKLWEGDIFAKNIKFRSFFPERIKAQGSLKGSIHFTLAGVELREFKADLVSLGPGFIYQIDYYDMLAGFPDYKRDSIKYVWDNFYNYHYKSATIRLSWVKKEHTFLIDFDFKGWESGNDRQVVVPVQIEEKALIFITNYFKDNILKERRDI